MLNLTNVPLYVFVTENGKVVLGTMSGESDACEFIMVVYAKAEAVATSATPITMLFRSSTPGEGSMERHSMHMQNLRTVVIP